MPLEQIIDFDNSYATELDGFYIPWQGDKAPSPQVVQLNVPLAEELGLAVGELDGENGANLFSGSELPEGAAPLSQVYAGHQFGGFSHQLGDGRALLIGEVTDRNGKRRDIQLKGSGRTPFSRGGDGKAGLGPVLREYLTSEAMFALGVPTTRSLAAVTTGEKILREEAQPGAVLTRIASSHIRVGTFQFFAARGDTDRLKQLADYTIRRHFPAIETAPKTGDDPYLSLLQTVIERQAFLVARWVAVGFVHGVMNTDNMTISGETIDYGPCAFMDIYSRDAVFSSIDTKGRYAFGNQPDMAQWNLARFAEALLPLIDRENSKKAVEMATDALSAFPEIYHRFRRTELKAKLGLTGKNETDDTLIDELFSTMEGQNLDYTLFFRHLADFARDNEKTPAALFDDPSAPVDWLNKWRQRLEQEECDPARRAAEMDRVNPLYIPRNHKVEEALEAAVNRADYSVFKKLLAVVTAPFMRHEGLHDYEQGAPAEFGHYRTFCGT